MKTKHTPGPWGVERDRDGDLIVSQPGNDGQVIVSMRGADGPEWDANARLIAAAPDLLAALRIITEWDPAASPNEPGGMSIMDAIDIAQAAIRKAEEGTGGDSKTHEETSR